MLRYLLPILDIITASVLLLHTRLGIFPLSAVMVLGIYLALKGLAFSYSDIPSRIDVIFGGYIIIVGLGLFSNATVSLIAFIWLMQKAVFALVPMS